jgi:transaldolase
MDSGAASALDPNLRALHALGQSAWIDFISRDALRSGALAELVAAGVRGLTSNPAIFERAIATGTTYDAEIGALAATGRSPTEIYETLAIADIAAAADLLQPVYDRSGGRDGFVSIEVSPRLAHDSAGTVAEGSRLWSLVARANVMIKVPGTIEGFEAIEQLTASGVNINVTLLFALDAYDRAVEAYLRGLEARAAAGEPLDRIASVASFFVSRVDAAVDALLAPAPGGRSLRGKAAIANARQAYARFLELFSGPRWETLAAQGARPQRPLWASTGTKDPAYPDTIYVDELIGQLTVNTMPPQTLAAFRDHGRPRESLLGNLSAARAELAALEAAGIDLNAVTDGLLTEGLRLFSEAFERLEAGLATKAATLTADCARGGDSAG